MNEYEILKTIEEEMLFVVQKIDELIEHKLQSGEINSEKYLRITLYMRKYAEESQNVVSFLRDTETVFTKCE